MEWEITKLVGLFEAGRITRRELVDGLKKAMDAEKEEVRSNVA